MDKVTPTFKKNLRLNMQWQLSEYFKLRDRMEIVSFHEKDNTKRYGYLLYQDILWKTNKAISGNFRLAWFHTDDFDTRLYAYENNVRYAYSIPFFYGKGIRSYANLRVNIGRKISLWAKIARSWYFDQKTIGSGWDEIKGNTRTRFILELIWEN